VLQRHAETARERLQELLVGRTERMLAVDVLERDRTGRLAAGDQWDEQDRLRALPGHDFASVPLELGIDAFDEQQRFARLHHMVGEAPRGARLRLQPLAALDHVRVELEARRLVEYLDRDGLSVEDRLALGGDRLV